MNWRLKILAKIVLSRLPIGYRTFYKFGLFRHGDMNRAEYAYQVVMGHARQLGADRFRDAVCLELGPGDSLASALIANALGARKTYLVDAGAFAEHDIVAYREIAEQLRAFGLAVADLSEIATIEEMLQRIGADYLTDGLASLRTIPSGSVDLVWSQAVLEHVRLAEVEPSFQELRRICARDARLSHRIDFMDHLGGSLNNLRFTQRVWESDFMASSGFYTNRIRSAEMQRAMIDAGFDLLEVSAGKWDRLPIARSAMAMPYSDLPEDDLLTKYIDVLVVPARSEVSA
ncbi:methyltransferase domain-containing protein [Sphingosinicella sp. LHD-64]|uniref:methyltransferase domain-containing protein n=1 Tax=Sphingosinicella sp. LHD-64 TaxID=3072139 RepID=UPI00280D42DB|nr:methyltransferase domain-containing protein [Sphingosinicella sp. LHD-64]MDQ8757226.1 methyltransferase domain-containing protein [Sphingosinicella sp. LHD-64]